MASKRGKKKMKKSMDEETVESPKNVTEDLQVAEEVEKHGEDQIMLDEDNVSSEESVQCDEMVLASDDSSSTSTSSSSSSSTSSSTFKSTSSSSLSSSSFSKMKKSRKKSKKEHCHPLAMARARTIDDVVRRYHKVAKAYKSQGSMNKAFKFVGVDRNTLALSAPLAEISIKAPKFLKSLPPFNLKKEKLLDYSKRCAESMTPEVRAKIEELKAKGKLLPIKYKYR
ncbi:unnamed protein product [Leuciscus chuanchicus]